MLRIRPKDNALVRLLIFMIIMLCFVMFIRLLPDLLNKFSNVYYKAIESEKGKNEALIILLFPFLFAIWLFLIIIKGDCLKALTFQIAIFPLTYKSQAAIAINAYQTPSGTIQKISITTFMIISLFVIMLYKRLIKRLPLKSWRNFEKILLTYAVVLTISQLINHNIYSAIWLSVGGIWQFVLLFYILSSLITNIDKLLILLRSIVVFTIINIFTRLLTTKQPLFQKLSADVWRVGSGAMGPAVSYGGYLAIVITIIIVLYRIKRKPAYIIIGIFIFLEMVNTFTRGAYLTFFILPFILLFTMEKKIILRMIAISLPIVFLFQNLITNYIFRRGSFLSKDIFNLISVKIRIDLIRIYLFKFSNLSIFGRGIGKLTYIETEGAIRKLTPHNILIALIDQGGIIVLILFLTMFVKSARKYISCSRDAKKGSVLYTLSIYLFAALIQWFFFANTTSTYLNFYYPYEASSIFWMVLFLPFIISFIYNQKKLNESKC